MLNYNKVLDLLFFFIDRSVDIHNEKAHKSHLCAYYLKEMIAYQKEGKWYNHYKYRLQTEIKSFEWGGNIPSRLWETINEWEAEF